MTKIRRAKKKISRSYGAILHDYEKNPFLTKNYPPGQHGPNLQRKPSDYGKHLRAKQILREMYNIKEKQFRNIFKEAARLKGDTGENLVGLLERRLDAVVFRLNIAKTIYAARQLVTHKHIKVNGVRANYPSMKLKIGDVVEIKNASREIPIIMETTAKISRQIPSYLEFDQKSMSGKFIRIPELAEIPYPTLVEPNLIIEFYSR